MAPRRLHGQTVGAMSAGFRSIYHMTLELVDHVPNIQIVHSHPSCTSLKDNEAVIRMIMKGRSPSLRRVSRTHRVDLD